MTGADVRKTFIDKELDQESKTYNTGVRQYEPSTGFTSIDPLWEKFRAHTPYHYSYNNPIVYKDPNGQHPVGAAIVAVIEIASTVYDVVDAVTTVADPNVSTEEKVVTVVGAGLGLVAPGGGYGTAARKGVKAAGKALQHADDVADAVKAGRAAEAAANRAIANKSSKTYQTYTKPHLEDPGKVYSGRTSGTGTPAENVAKRDKNHHMNKEGYGKAVLDKSSANKDAIRGREQQLIDRNGGAQKSGGTSGNKNNGISRTNPNYGGYIQQANEEFY